MGNCCIGSNNDNDIENNLQNNISKQNKNEKSSSLVYQNQKKNNIGIKIENIHKVNTDSLNLINQKEFQHIIQEKNLYLSKNKLKLIIKQSKSLLEGKEFIINSLGLTEQNNKNNHKDGIVIFGDTNVSEKIYLNNINVFIYRLVHELILHFQKKKVIQSKTMQK